MDVNGDGAVNILDLVAVANAFGKAEPGLNGDGVVIPFLNVYIALTAPFTQVR